ncbi:Heat shock 70 kDa protein 13 [Holothuria leucospilota]|uniref:Heat shock 70 kDa protein 13 n=1 Tax=Holothuria leucospilota TaxID=206669 RepID=A0A9Q1BX77_HOLLE|nr:Heat shock 70 kDa protein 13 [Holothuria leucospilota]
MSTAVTIFGLSVLALLLAGYLGQQYLPPPKPRIVGIDLGTTYSCVAVYHAVTGDVEVIPADKKHKTIPSMVAFTPDGERVGYAALSHIEEMPASTIFDAKRFIGKTFSEKELALEMERYQFQAILKNGGAIFQIGEHSPYQLISPEEVGSKILSTLCQASEKMLEVPVTKTVMAVPAEFDEFQRNATRQAAELAGLEVMRIINEPTAAAMAYGLHKREDVTNIVVVDFGGGTLDVSLLNIQGGMFQTFAIAGNNHLGGQDLNHRLMVYLQDLIERNSGKSLKNLEDIQHLRLAVEETKLQLTNHNSSTMTIKLPSVNSQPFNFTVTRKKFEEINRDIFLKVLEPIRIVLKESEMTPSEVDEIILVGGSTRVPKVREIVGEFFGKPPNTEVDPELAVAYGVALQAGIIGGMWPLKVSAIEIHNRKVRKINLS